ncbi:MAG: folate-binding protein [Rothia sp. (in: high G+C Gram-positive bacteria)]|uniref:CAF17-like 4Fe-4S cluster assembly/insertion protein YgfZ n=1 Tax=Rothia sp. (in: high G+C Gram-positive bacteria) TaxID=1885016 RepID=UPI00270616EE|nr:folate-binding protein [Rothia sp. (in: high G+C Gram-positive bacteria)]
MTAYRSPLLSRPGAFAASGADAGVAAHYGDPMAEQRALARRAQLTLVDHSNLGVVTVAGEDRLSWLTTLSSQVLAGLEEGGSTELLLLTPQGRIEFSAFAVEKDGAVWLITERDQATPLTDYLNRMKFMLRVDITDRTETHAVLGSTLDPRQIEGADAVLAGGTVWVDPWGAGIAPGGYTYASAGESEHPASAYRRYLTVVPAHRLLDAVEGAQLAGSWAAEALRIEAWRPRVGVDSDEKTIPHELDLLRTAVHLEKGCYKGQETVARVHNLGHPPRRLTFLDLDGSEHTLPAAGSVVMNGEKKVGTVTSVALHHEAGPIALAVLKRSVDPAAALRVVDGGDTDADGNPATSQYAAAQTVIVAPDAGQVAGRRNMGDFLR